MQHRYSPEFNTYLSLPAVLGRSGVQKILPLSMTDTEKELLRKVADGIRERVDEAMPIPEALPETFSKAA